MGTWNTSMCHLALSGLAVLAWTSPALAQSKGVAQNATAAAAANAPAKPDEKVDISDLENKYWAPKDTDFSVVQNRTYTKEHRFFLAPQWGRPINDPYSEGDLFGATFNYFWSERMGVQATYFKAELQNNEATNDIAKLGSGAIPDHGKLTGYYGVGFNLVPFYAKMSFWGKKIIYFDMAFTPTIGMTSYDQVTINGNRDKSALTFGLDVTQFFFFSNFFAIRADLKNQWHSQEILKARQTGSYQTGDKVTDKTIHDTLFLLGLTFFY
ncbi:MAG: outer membrane beta-barrel domain-containing protein [Bdellovibrionales bacterium]